MRRKVFRSEANGKLGMTIVIRDAALPDKRDQAVRSALDYHLTGMGRYFSGEEASQGAHGMTYHNTLPFLCDAPFSWNQYTP